MEDTHFLLASTPDTLDEVYRLRYTCYHSKGAIAPHPEQRFHDVFDQHPNSFSFLARNAKQESLATVRITVVKAQSAWTESPGRSVFGDHPAFDSLASESYVEASRLCFRHQARRGSFIGLLGHMAALAEFHDVGWLVACPRVEHAPVYQRLFGFRPLAPPRKYFGVSFETELLGIRRSDLAEHVRDEQCMTGAWRQALALTAATA